MSRFTYADTIDQQEAFAVELAGPLPLNRWDGFRDWVTANQVRKADSFFLAEDLGALVVAAAESLPEGTEVDASDFASSEGWMLFEEPAGGYRIDYEINGVGRPTALLFGIYWFVFDGHLLGLFRTDDPLGAAIVLPFDANHDDGCPCMVYDHTSMDWWRKWFKALWLLLGQGNVTEIDRMPLPRAQRKRAERMGRYPEVRVIRLPRHVSDSDGTRDVAWRSRWIVSGHWRRQPWGPGRQKIRPVWIAPYLKGPEDAPLKPQAHRLFVAGGKR